MKALKVSRMSSSLTIKLGYDGENNWRPQLFDCSSLLENHPDGIMTLWVQPQNTAKAFPVALEHGEGNVYIWTPQDEEITALRGKLQFMCVDGTDVGKSDVAHWSVGDSIVSGAEHPEDVPSWAVRVVEATGHYPKIENGNWYVWDVQNGEWADTGVSAGGDVSPEQIEAAVEDYLDEHPITVTETDPTVPAWAKQPQKPTYTANEVGALPADTPIPAAVTEQTVSGWGFTKNTGTYSKPSGGIPKDDLTSGVQEVLDSAITTGNFGSYLDNEGKVVFPLSVSGTTVTLDTSFIYVYHAYASSRDAVFVIKIGGTADAPDVLSLRPTRFNATAFSVTLIGEHNGNRYSVTLSAASANASPMTGTLVTTPLQELPTVTAADNGKFLRVVNGAWNKGYQAARIPRVAMTASDTTPTIDPNKLYVFPEMASLAPTLATPTDNTIVNEYHFIFTSGATATTLTLPATILQPDGFTVEANHVYEISILENCMTAQGWAVSA